jgi:hypothetical protein
MFEAVPTGTRLKLVAHGADVGYLRLPAPMLRLLARPVLGSNLGRLRKVLESGQCDP